MFCRITLIGGVSTKAYEELEAWCHAFLTYALNWGAKPRPFRYLLEGLCKQAHKKQGGIASSLGATDKTEVWGHRKSNPELPFAKPKLELLLWLSYLCLHR